MRLGMNLRDTEKVMVESQKSKLDIDGSELVVIVFL